MAWNFGDGFDLYAAPADMANGYWDSGAFAGFTLVAGRFSGSQAVNNSGTTSNVTKSSGVNDVVHHIACAFRQSTAITGSSLGLYLQLLDGTTGQCAIVFRSDGAILLTSGNAAGTVLATYTGAFPVTNTWYAFEFEVVINNTTGAFRVRKNGNTSTDFDSGAINTRGGTANNYANKLTMGMQTVTPSQQVDDLFWRSDTSSVAWMGDLRCYTRMPASDASVQFSRTPSGIVQQTNISTTGTSLFGQNAYFNAITAAWSGTISTVTITLGASATGHLKAAFYDGARVAVLATSAEITNPAAGAITFTFSPPLAVTKGTSYWFAMCSDVSINYTFNTTSVANQTFATTYSSFPVTNPGTGGAGGSKVFTLNIDITTAPNAAFVNEAQQDSATSYVFDSTVGHTDLYNVAGISSTPSLTVAVTTRGYVQKSDTGPRSTAMQLKSGATTVASPTVGSLAPGVWTWLYRTDIVDPNTGAAWTPTAVNSAQIGPLIVT
jgi:hypothetical protein